MVGRYAIGVGCLSNFQEKKCYQGVRFNVITITRGWMGVVFSEKKALRNTRMAPNMPQ